MRAAISSEHQAAHSTYFVGARNTHENSDHHHPKSGCLVHNPVAHARSVKYIESPRKLSSISQRLNIIPNPFLQKATNAIVIFEEKTRSFDASSMQQNRVCRYSGTCRFGISRLQKSMSIHRHLYFVYAGQGRRLSAFV